MTKERADDALVPVLCDDCRTHGPGITMIGECEECHGPTSSGDLKLCGKCAAAAKRCGRCKKPLDEKG